jgi:toxin ParE1/3/4
MVEYVLSRRAEADLDSIFVHTISTFGLPQAERYRDQLAASLERVVADPRLGKALIGRSRMFFQYNCLRHGIFFTMERRGIFVVRVLHLSMDFKRHLP